MPRQEADEYRDRHLSHVHLQFQGKFQISGAVIYVQIGSEA